MAYFSRNREYSLPYKPAVTGQARHNGVSSSVGSMVRKHFGTDGIRGRANTTITPELALKVGQAAGLMFRNGDHRHRVLIGKDTRLSGYMIETAMVAGFTSVGMDVLLTGPMPTPAVAMLTRSMRADLGVMISASHNPYDDNGIKLFGPDGHKLSDEIELKIEELMDSDLTKQLAKSAALGRAKRIDGVQDRYIEFAKRTLPRNLSLDGMRIAVDCANGAAYSVAPAALWELGAEVVAIGIEPDGFNINHECGSTAPDALCTQAARNPRRHRHRARRRRRPRRADRRARPPDRRRPDHGGDRGELEGRGPPRQARRGRHRDVESRAGALPGIEGHRAGPHRGRRPLRARGDAQARLQPGRRGVRPHHPVGLRDHRRRPGRGAAGAGGGEEARPAPPPKCAAASSRCRR